MKCLNCNTDNDNDAVFCKKCGKPLSQTETYVYSDKDNPDAGTCESNISPDMILDSYEEEVNSSYTFQDWLDSIDLEKKWKIILKTIHDKVVWVGEQLLPIGRYIVQLVKKIVHDFSGTITGIIIGGILGLLISSIPLIGWVLGPILIPLFAFAGGIIGLGKDLINKLPTETKDALIAKAKQVCHGFLFI